MCALEPFVVGAEARLDPLERSLPPGIRAPSPRGLGRCQEISAPTLRPSSLGLDRTLRR